MPQPCRTVLSMLARPAGRRDLISRVGLGAAAALTSVRGTAIPASAQDDGEEADCRIVGVTGGGVVRTAGGDATVVLFASRFVDGGGQPAEGKVRWLDPAFDGGLTLESIGPIVYEDVADDPASREIRGIAQVNGEREEPFVLRVTDNSETGDELDRCVLQAGNLIGGEEAASGEFGYAAEGEIVGGDILLLGPS